MKVLNKTRRQFLKNFSLASLSVGLLPTIAKGNGIAAESKATLNCNLTTPDYYGEGPFYTPNPPTIQNNLLVASTEPGVRLILSGQVRTLDCTELIHNAVIDVWHANDAGAYDNVGYNLRGITYSNNQGFYMFETILPGHYLNGANYRPSHIHLKITPPGFATLTTQLYFEGDQYIPIDAAASISSGQYDATHRIIPITMNTDGKYEGTWDIVVDGNGTVGMSDLHLEKGMIYSASPNPFSDSVNINYGVFHENVVSLWVFDLQGRTVAKLEEKSLKAEKYTATWQPDSNLPKGYYFIALKVNDIQVHYIKVLKH
ncbi:MAG: T9SS type A sorting domain-containing protein [Bacteroidales bacterium]|nr:T9SS type A sorting domain-containing protein [Bacteroidales bacterium]MCF8457551.1 T9SS type A sorting domain-containing protein [Bacteroidales bacterium]